MRRLIAVVVLGLLAAMPFERAWAATDVTIVGFALGSGDFTGAVDIDGNLTVGADNYVTTVTAATGDMAVTGAVDIDGAITANSTLDVDGATTLNSTLDVDGNVVMGAANFRSTFTAASGIQAWTGALTAPTFNGAVVGGALSGTTLSMSGAGAILGALEVGAENAQSTITAAGIATFNTSVTAPALNGTTSIAGGAISGTTLAMSGAGAVLGAFEMGAENTQSTHTATGNLTVHAAVSAGTTLTAGTNITATAGFIQLYSRSIAQLMALTPAAVGQMYFCNDCSPVEIAVSTGTALGQFGNAAGAQLD